MAGAGCFFSDKKAGARVKSPAKFNVMMHAMNCSPVPPLSDDNDSFDAKLMATPGLAEAYIQVTQEVYDKQVKSGELPPPEAKKALALMRQFHSQMRGAIARRELARMAKRLLRMERKNQISPKDMEFLMQCKSELSELEKLVKKALQEQRQILHGVLANVEFKAVLLVEKGIVQEFGKTAAREMLSAGGGMLPSDMVKQAKKGRGQSRRTPPSAKGPREQGPAARRRRTGQ